MMNSRAMLITVVLLVPLFFINYNAEAKEEKNDIKLFFHTSGATTYMNTIGPSDRNIDTTASKEISIQPSLAADLEVHGYDTGAGQNLGFWLTLRIIGNPLSTTQVTIAVLDNTETIANKTFDLTGAVSSWQIPFVQAIQEYTFKKDHFLILKITAKATVGLSYDGSYLTIPCDSIDLNVATYDAKDKPTTKFYPNAPDSFRVLNVKGSILDRFGSYDISSVVVEIADKNDKVVSAGEATVKDSNYNFTWKYSKGIDTGKYTVTVKVRDNQNFTYNESATITVKDYGVFLSCVLEDKDGNVVNYTSPGKGAEYPIIVTNSGSKQTSVSFKVASEVQSDWNTRFEPSSLASLQPGEAQSIRFIVTPATTVEIGKEAIITIEAVAEGDTSMPKENWQMRTITRTMHEKNFEMVIVGAWERYIEPGSNATYQIKLMNTGSTKTNITFQLNGIPATWSAEMRYEGEKIITITLDINEEKNLELFVLSPQRADENEAAITIVARTEDGLVNRQVNTVTRITKISMTISPDEKTASPNEKVEYKITLDNFNPSLSLSVKLSTKPPEGWESAVLIDGRKTTEVSIPPSGTKILILSVTPPETAEANEYQGYIISVLAEQTNNPSNNVEKSVKIKVRQKYGISLSIDGTNEKIGNIIPGQKVSYELKVKNNGNGEETVSILVLGFPSDWYVKVDNMVSPIHFVLGPNGKGRDVKVLNLTIQAPATLKFDLNIRGNITAASANAQASVFLSLKTKVDLIKKVMGVIADAWLYVTLLIILVAIVIFVRKKAT
ncbi:MAG: hypothetical protein AB1779_04935 [Candidatus Thermoplasmatota archaeon]